MKYVVKSLLVAATLAVSSTLVSAQTLSIEAGGSASTTGLIPQSFAPYASKAGYDLQVVLDQVLTKSVLKVGAGKLDLAVTPPPAFKSMQAGKGPYSSNAEQSMELAKNVRALFAFQGSTMHPTVWADSSIKNWEDVRGKRVFIGPPAGAAAGQTTGMIEAASGLKADVDYEAIKLPWGQATQGFQDGQYDVYVAYFPVGSQSITELGLQRAVRLLGLPEGLTETDSWKTYENQSGVTGVNIPSGTYGDAVVNSTDSIDAAATSMMIVTNASMSEEAAYNLTKAYFDALPEMKQSNALLKSQDESKPLFGITAKLHAGAIRYYKEKGINIPEDLM
ncbi:TAXI family TRAP transporter solute-binding subunit [Ahrensia kielensis]|uniref:TAXI family TRAP transporter solute-binding subunit n=1 Tax=Ahrensia kielensis TaxID=76980 RepID=UPI00036326A6|nr:TAXI family TRAP transporter solute-binding subunit [Ahrensia kielensis]